MRLELCTQCKGGFVPDSFVYQMMSPLDAHFCSKNCRDYWQAHNQKLPKTIYVIGALANPTIPAIGNQLRDAGFNVFDDWHSAGPDADTELRRYEAERSHGVVEALAGLAAQHVYQFDLKHLKEADAAVMVMPCGKSGHLELGWMLGQGKPGFILFEKEPERFDLMWLLATGLHMNIESLVAGLRAAL